MSSLFKKSHFLNIFIFSLLFNLYYSSLKFNIPNNRDKCFSEEMYQDGTLLVRYDLKGVESIKKEHQENVLNNIKLFVKDPTDKIIRELYLINRKGKFALRAEKEGFYKICARYYKTWSVKNLPQDVLLGIKLRSDYEYKEIENSLQIKDVENLVNQIKNLKYKVIPSISSSRKDIVVFYQIFNLKRFFVFKENNLNK